MDIKAVACLMRRLDRKLFLLYSREFEEYGVSAGMSRIMLTVYFHPEYNQKAVSDELRFTEANMSVCVKKLKELGYITAEQSDEDRRSKVLRLTEAGVAVLKNVKLVLDDFDDTLYGGFSKEELTNLNNYLQRLEENIDGIKEKFF